MKLVGKEINEVRMLVKALGYREDHIKKSERKIRYRGEERGLLDIWFGKKKTTIGIYDESLKKMIFKCPESLEEIEKIVAIK